MLLKWGAPQNREPPKLRTHSLKEKMKMAAKRLAEQKVCAQRLSCMAMRRQSLMWPNMIETVSLLVQGVAVVKRFLAVPA